MLLTLTLTSSQPPATDLGYLLQKHPARVQAFEVGFGQAHVFYPEATETRCTAALLLEADPERVRRRHGGDFALGAYVNDRAFAASSFLSVAIARVYGSALKGRCDENPELAQMALPLRAQVAALPCADGGGLLRGLFEPLGYDVEIVSAPLDEHFPEWGESPYYTVDLTGHVRLADLLTHLYVLIPVLDDDKHYYVDEEEIDKLARFGAGWLEAHPQRKLIVDRYLKHQRRLSNEAVERLLTADGQSPADDTRPDTQPDTPPEPPLYEQRLQAVLAALRDSGARRVLDLGCGNGRLLRHLLDEARFERVVGVDVDHRALEQAGERLRLDEMPPERRARVELLHGSLLYRDQRLAGYDAAAVVEVVEHLDPPRLSTFERVLFEFARPATVVLTTPNADYNPVWESLPAGEVRHADHRFEWRRDQFRAWATAVGERHGYTTRFTGIGQEHPDAGSPSQMAVFTRS